MDTYAINLTGTLISYYHTCRRKLWLHAHEIRMEHTSDLVAEGKLIEETAYERRPDKLSQVQFDGVKIDFFDARARVVHETKRGRAVEAAHIAQVQYYLYKLHRHGITGASGIIEYPDLRKTQPIPPIDEALMRTIKGWENDVQHIVALPECPPVVEKPYCRRCAYHDLCYISEP